MQLSVVHLLQSQVEELRTSLGGGLRNCLLDPVVNSMFRQLSDELRETKQRLEQSQQELNAWKFTPDRWALFFYYCLFSIFVYF